MQRTAEEKIELFERTPIHKAALTLVIPTVISQLVVLVYNLADTWFIGQTGDPHQVAAVTVTYPIFMLLSAFANLFGIGGSSLISRMLGGGEQEKTGVVATFSLWAAGGVTLIYASLCFLFDGVFLRALGTDAETLVYAKEYLFWTVVIGGIPTVLNLVLANLIRAQGEARTASIGMSLGGIINVFLDPVFIFLFGMGVAGAAAATCLSICSSRNLFYRNTGGIADYFGGRFKCGSAAVDVRLCSGRNFGHGRYAESGKYSISGNHGDFQWYFAFGGV